MTPVCLLLVAILFTSLHTTDAQEENEFLYHPAPFELASALCGYDLFKGEPYFIGGTTDPGSRYQIFLATGQKSGFSDYVVKYKGITWTRETTCGSELKSKVVTTSEQIREQMAESVSTSGSVGFEMKAEVGAEAGGATATTTVENSASLAFSNSNSMQKMTEYLSDGKHAMVVQEVSCIHSKLKLSKWDVPHFTDGFKGILRHLNNCNNKSKEVQIEAFKDFINDYGTHYMKEVEMGAKMTYTKFLKADVRKEFNEDVINKCETETSGVSYLFVKASKSKTKCGAEQKSSLNSKDVVEENVGIKTRGSKIPASVEEWASQEFTPVPLKVKLRPITELMEDRALKEQENLKIDGAGLRKWFKPLMSQYCQFIMGKTCVIRKGCGYTDKCKFNEFCVEGKCKALSADFTAAVQQSGDQLKVTLGFPYWKTRFMGASFTIKYKGPGYSGWKDLETSGKKLIYTTSFPRSPSYCGTYHFKAQAYNTDKELIEEQTVSARRTLNSPAGGICSADWHCADGISSTHCLSGKCQCRTQYYRVGKQCKKGVIHTKHICEGKELKLQCGDGLKLLISAANYGRTGNSKCKTNNKKAKMSCRSKYSLFIVKHACQGKNSCSVKANNGVFKGDPCKKTKKYLEVSYRCVADGAYQFDFQCEKKTLKMECPDGLKLKILYATYGRQTTKICWGKSSLSSSKRRCRSSDSTALVKKECDGEESCNIKGENKKFGDPCKKTKKYLLVSYECVSTKCSDSLYTGVASCCYSNTNTCDTGKAVCSSSGNPTEKCCRPKSKCGVGQGNCKTDEDCLGDLKCGTRNCQPFGHSNAQFNCCYKPENKNEFNPFCTETNCMLKTNQWYS